MYCTVVRCISSSFFIIFSFIPSLSNTIYKDLIFTIEDLGIMGGGSRVFSSDITIHDTSINNSSKKEKHNNNNNNNNNKQKQKQKPSCCVAKERSIEVLGMKDNIVVVKQTNKTSNSSSSSNH
jgi:hypothetical protein